VICADTFEEAVLRKVKRLNVDLLLVPYGWAAEEKKWPQHGKELHRVVKKTVKLSAPRLSELMGLAGYHTVHGRDRSMAARVSPSMQRETRWPSPPTVTGILLS